MHTAHFLSLSLLCVRNSPQLRRPWHPSCKPFNASRLCLCIGNHHWRGEVSSSGLRGFKCDRSVICQYDLWSAATPGHCLHRSRISGLLCFLQRQQSRCQQRLCLLFHTKRKTKVWVKNVPEDLPDQETTVRSCLTCCWQLTYKETIFSFLQSVGLSVFLTHCFFGPCRNDRREMLFCFFYLMLDLFSLAVPPRAFPPGGNAGERNDPLGQFK